MPREAGGTYAPSQVRASKAPGEVSDHRRSGWSLRNWSHSPDPRVALRLSSRTCVPGQPPPQGPAPAPGLPGRRPWEVWASPSSCTVAHVFPSVADSPRQWGPAVSLHNRGSPIPRAPPPPPAGSLGRCPWADRSGKHYATSTSPPVITDSGDGRPGFGRCFLQGSSTCPPSRTPSPLCQYFSHCLTSESSAGSGVRRRKRKYPMGRFRVGAPRGAGLPIPARDSRTHSLPLRRVRQTRRRLRAQARSSWRQLTPIQSLSRW